MSEEKKTGLYIVISAPSGTGKTSILKEVLNICPQMIYSVSYTTRTPRPGEIDGKDYFFISEKEFREKIEAGEFVEWEENYGYYYGTSHKTIKEFLEKGYDLLFDIDPRGAKALKRSFPEGVFVFILPPSLDDLKKRLYGRGIENENAKIKRLGRALDEIKEFGWYDYVIVNNRIETAVDKLVSIYVAEKIKTSRIRKEIEELLANREAFPRT